MRDLAPSFGDLLLMAGRYDERRRAGAGEDDVPVEAIVEAIDDGIDLSDEQRRSWADLIS